MNIVKNLVLIYEPENLQSCKVQTYVSLEIVNVWFVYEQRVLHSRFVALCG